MHLHYYASFHILFALYFTRLISSLINIFKPLQTVYNAAFFLCEIHAHAFVQYGLVDSWQGYLG
jgi:hypothetical protein